MNDLESQIYDGIKTLLFEDYPSTNGQPDADPTHGDFGHTYSLLGCIQPGSAVPQHVYLGVSIDKLGQLHIEQILGQAYITDPSKFNVNDNLSMPDISGLEAQAKTLTNQLTQANAAVDQAQNAYNQAKNAADSANTALNNANTALSNAQKKLANDQTALMNDQNQLQKDETEQANAAKLLPAAQQKLANDEKNLTNAQNDVKKAQVAYNQANDKLNSLKAQLAKDEAQLANDEKKLSNLENTMNDYKNAPAKLANAKKALTDAQTALNNAKQALANAKATMSNDQNTLAQKKAALAHANTVLANVQNAYRQASHPMNTAEMGNVVTLTSSDNTVKADTVNDVFEAKKASNMKSSMPQTGEASSSKATEAGEIGLAFASILAGLGLGYKRRH